MLDRAGPPFPGDLGASDFGELPECGLSVLKTIMSPVGCSHQLAAWSDSPYIPGRGIGHCPGPRPSGQVPASWGGALQGHSGLSGQTVKYFLFNRKISFPPKKGQAKRRGLDFLYFLIKCHLLSVKQRSVSCSAWGQINISVTGGLWTKARWTRSCQQLLAPLLCLASRILCPPP